MQAFLKEKQAEIAEICRRNHVRQLFVFGSAAREDFNPKRSDVDFLVEFDEMPGGCRSSSELEEELVQLLGRDIDLIVRRFLKNPY